MPTDLDYGGAVTPGTIAQYAAQTPNGTTQPYVAPAPAVPDYVSPTYTGAPVAAPISADAMQQIYLNDPNYKQGMQWLTDAYNTNLARENARYGLSSQYQTGSTWTPDVYTPETIPASYYEQIALQKEKAAHDYANQQKYQSEMRYSTGNSGGQIGVDQGELTYNYDTMLKDIALQAKAREESVAQANARGAASVARSNANNQASIAQSQANEAISRQIKANEHTYTLEDYTQKLAIDKYTLLSNVTDHYKDLWWDPNTGVYRGPTA